MLSVRRGFIVGIVFTLCVVFVVPAAYASMQRQIPDLPPISPELLSAIYAGLLSLALSYIPGLNTKWAGLSEEIKMALMALGLLLISLGVFAASCAPALGIAFVACSTGGVLQLLSIFVQALIANQAVHRISPQTKAVKAVKAFAVRH